MKILYIAFTLFALTSLSSCHSELDSTPDNEVNLETVINSEENINQLLIGLYNQLGKIDNFGGGSQIMSDLLGTTTQIKWNGTQSAFRQVLEKNMLTDNEIITRHWTGAYSIINQCNIILDHLHVIKSSEQERNRIEGEAKFIRGLLYFDLIKIYAENYSLNGNQSALGVPLRLTGILNYADVNLNKARNTVEEVYSQIIEDLNSAEILLEDNTIDYADKYTVKFLKARVFLQMGDYNNALNEADKVITESGHALNSEYQLCFNQLQPTQEDVFVIYPANSSTQIVNLLNNYYSSSQFGGTSSLLIDSSYFSVWLNVIEDERSQFFTEVNGNKLSLKYQKTFGTIGLFRLAEMYLIRLECNFELGSHIGDTPENDLLKLYNRAGASFGGSIPNINFILQERQRELGFEGLLIHDLKRRHQNVGDLLYSDPKLIAPIPQSEMESNKLMVQNDGY
ncbi:MAG: RagB/SusD family nutrient uptake outer membrane protein [Flavobacteriales bacterium]